MIHLKIKEIAASKGLSLKAVCDKAGYKSLPSFYRQINNPESLNMKTLIRIADVLGCELSDLFIGQSLQFTCPYCEMPISVSLHRYEPNAIDIKATIKKYGVSMKSLTDKIKEKHEKRVSVSAVSQMINGNPTLSSISKIASIVGIPVPELLGGESCICPHCNERIKITLGS